MMCPGRQRLNDLTFACSIQEKSFKDVVPSAVETIGHLRFDTVFSLARLISIYDHERCLERKRLLMMDPKYVFITLSGVRKAFLYFKKCCDHIFRGLATHDGSSLALPHDGGTGLPIEQLNDANNEGVRFAKSNDWDEMEANEEPSKPLIILPESFSMVDVFFKAQPTVRRQIYHELSEIGSILDRAESQCCVIVGPTTDVPPSKREWCKLASSLAAAARNGMKIIVVAPPRGDKAYERNRIDMNEALELAKSVAVLAKQNLISCIPVIESSTEPSHGPGARPRSSSNENYSKGVMKDYFEVLSTYLKGEVDIPPFEEKPSRNARTHQYFREKRTGRGISKTPHVSFRTFADKQHQWNTPYNRRGRGQFRGQRRYF
ncbi:unnamed protein product [Heligmosomoides polygyrus]|uniref:Macro domain-containing protein n=1 Tax=Heligmosomoides polygyrus TaxID=6339 RepID=A0A183GCE8_HELPZ|nr:unnamed protein product [Heligmosomoides polygyrus]